MSFEKINSGILDITDDSSENKHIYEHTTENEGVTEISTTEISQAPEPSGNEVEGEIVKE